MSRWMRVVRGMIGMGPTFAAIAGVFLAAGCAAGPSASASADVAPVEIAGPVAGNTIFTFETGDYISPRLSATGRYVAVSEVLVEAEYENTRVLVVDLDGGIVDTVLTAARARNYGVYASYVGAMEWRGDDTLLVSVYDGDVNGTRLTIHIPTGAIVQEDFLEAGWEPLPPDLQEIADRLEDLHPTVRPRADWTGESVFEAAMPRAVVVPERGVVLQKNFSGFDHNVWFYSLTDGEAFELVMVPDQYLHSFGGGASVNGRTAFAVTWEGRARLFLWSSDGVEQAAEFPARVQAGQVVVRASGEAGVWINLKVHRPSERGHNPAFFLDSAGLLEVLPQIELYDFDVDPGNRRIAFAHWIDDRREVQVRSLGAN